MYLLPSQGISARDGSILRLASALSFVNLSALPLASDQASINEQKHQCQEAQQRKD